MAVLTRKQEISGPPAYLTEDWNKVLSSIKHLQSLDPAIILPSHGKPLRGLKVKEHLDMLVSKIEKML